MEINATLMNMNHMNGPVANETPEAHDVALAAASRVGLEEIVEKGRLCAASDAVTQPHTTERKARRSPR